MKLIESTDFWSARPSGLEEFKPLEVYRFAHIVTVSNTNELIDLLDRFPDVWMTQQELILTDVGEEAMINHEIEITMHFRTEEDLAMFLLMSE